ncbi:ciliary-associated calcium-binding coiled-coil protein 1-like [Polyodon spathula]|uniref:ciliary-associated calcium-binding coiled-coil protein 1-like n=1 Tax=Polyodon spathula TaxID=7913 RepID=UPI001B7F25A6|nr:ciliary-associated calcium-binding coiled-coil protein 1-like [Polyodon spathula]
MAGKDKMKPLPKSQMLEIQVQEKKQNTDNEASEKEHQVAWKFLSHSQVSMLSELSVEEVQKKMEDILQFKNRQTCLKEAALLDYYVSGFWWAKEMNFTSQQISGFMTLLHMLLENAKKHMSLVENWKELAKTMAGIGQSSPVGKGGIEFFSVDQAISIIDYFKSSLFQHYKLYEFLFSQPRDELVLSLEENIEVIKPTEFPFPAPLEEGLPSDIYSQFMAPAPAEQNEDKMDKEDYDERTPVTEAEVKDPLEGYTMADVKSVLGLVTRDIIENLQTEISEKLRAQEETYIVRMDKLKNS